MTPLKITVWFYLMNSLSKLIWKNHGSGNNFGYQWPRLDFFAFWYWLDDLSNHSTLGSGDLFLHGRNNANDLFHGCLRLSQSSKSSTCLLPFHFLPSQSNWTKLKLNILVGFGSRRRFSWETQLSRSKGKNYNQRKAFWQAFSSCLYPFSSSSSRRT